jgi:uncharacterized circularly permuted ATP-grasp superfamily protein/uncharacterized alpha-E superfamily protein
MGTGKTADIEAYFQSLPKEALQRDISRTRRRLQELNLTYLGQQDAEGLRIAIDPSPMVLDAEEMQALQDAGDQWGRLLTALHHDLWGEQTVLDSGQLDQRFLWETLAFDPSLGARAQNPVENLSLIRLDMERDLNGRWGLLSLGSEMPRGLGYLIGNRIVHSRYFGQGAPQSSLIRLAPFLKNLKEHWFQSSLTHKDEPSIVIWTEGPSDPHYFEPVFLSRYFGYPLVESRDLTVRSGKVYLKTLGNLEPVDVLVRLVPDRRIDPLVGNPGSLGGVAGLLQAYRDGSVMITNAPGSRLLQAPQLLPHFPKLARFFLREELLITVGQPGENLQTGHFFEEGQWAAHSLRIRVFFARTLRGGWQLIPGGIVQKTPSPTQGRDSFFGLHKDLWFLSSDTVPKQSLLPRREKPTIINRLADLPSRVADDLFWLGRYTERAWSDLRFLEKRLQNPFEGRLEEQDLGQKFLDDLLIKLGVVITVKEKGRKPVQKLRLKFLLSEITRLASQVLDRLSLENHTVLRELGDIPLPEEPTALGESLREMKLLLAAFNGLTMESMTRTPGWLFLDLGKRLERAQTVVDSLAGYYALEPEESSLSFILDVFDVVLTYSSRYRLDPQRSPVLDLLLLDPNNPRSLAYQIERLEEHIELLPRSSQRPYRSPLERQILELLTKVRLTEATELKDGVLMVFLRDLTNSLENIGNTLHQTYLAKIDSMESLKSRGYPGQL